MDVEDALSSGSAEPSLLPLKRAERPIHSLSLSFPHHTELRPRSGTGGVGSREARRKMQNKYRNKSSDKSQRDQPASHSCLYLQPCSQLCNCCRGFKGFGQGPALGAHECCPARPSSNPGPQPTVPSRLSSGLAPAAALPLPAGSDCSPGLALLTSAFPK